MEPRVEQSCRLVGPFQVAADHVEMPGLISVERALGYAGMRLRPVLQHHAHRREMIRRDRRRGQRLDLQVEDVDLEPHLGRDQRPQHSGIFPRGADHGLHRGRIAGVQQVKLADGALGRLGMLLVELHQIAVDPRDRQPVPRIVGIARERVGHVQDTRHVLDPLHVAAEPEGGLGVAGDEVHLVRAGRAVHQASTHVSLEPPPWEELTTSDPGRRATRVRPPGSTHVSFPVTANGRRSI